MIFKDRKMAGKVLAERLEKINIENPLIIAIPRGGVMIAEPAAQKYKTAIKLIIPRKIGAPVNQEVAIGAVTQDGTVIFDEYLMGILGVNKEELTEDVQREVEEISRRSKIYPNMISLDEVHGRDVVLMDDGIATGYTIMAALKSLRNKVPRSLSLAIPVAPPEIIQKLEPEVNHIVCLESPEDFYAVGQFYEDFDQVSDDEVIKVLKNNS